MANKYFNYDNVAYLWEKIKSLASGKVDKETGKGLSSNDYTAEEKAKLANIAAGAEVNVNADWDAVTGDAAILNKPTNLSDFTDDVTVQSNWNEADSTKKDFIKNKPTIPTRTSDLTNDSNFVVDANYTHITVDSIISDSSTNPVQNSVIKDYVDEAIGSISGLQFSIVQALPATGESNIIYLVPNSGTNPNSYDEYIWITVSGVGRFEKIGTTDIDLSDYLKVTDMIPLTTSEIDAICV